MTMSLGKNTPSSIVCFKNGYSFITTPLELESVDDCDAGTVNEAVIGPLPEFVVHGTIGLQPQDKTKLKILSISKASQDKIEKLQFPEGKSSIPLILKANEGKYVHVSVSIGKGMGGGYSQMQGKVKMVNWNEASPEDSLVCLQVKKGNNEVREVLVKVEDVQVVEAGSPPDGTVTNELLVRYSSCDQSPTATLSYLTQVINYNYNMYNFNVIKLNSLYHYCLIQGLTWAPSYYLVLDTENKTLQLEGRACLMCDIGFMDGDIIPEVCLVAGVPRMVLKDVNDPLVSGGSANQFIDVMLGMESEGSQGFGAGRRKARSMPGMMSMSQAANSGGLFGASRVEDAEGVSGGETIEDFFHYVLKNVPLKHQLPISLNFIENVPVLDYQDIYFINLNKADMVSKGEVEVNHAISFRNKSGQPLTTAPATILARNNNNKTNRFMVQGMLKFSMPGQNVDIEITTTQDVQVSVNYL